MDSNEVMDELEVQKIRAEIREMLAHTAKLRVETWFYPLIVGAALVTAGAALGRYFA